MEARIRAEDAPEGLPFTCDATFLRQMKLLDLATRFGDLDLSFEPSGTGGYEDALEDIIRSKEAANREKDRQALPTLRLLLEKTRGGTPPRG
jgi:hypothetical protein